MSTAPLHWIEQIQDTLIDLKQIPLHGFAPPFPWANCSKEIGALLSAPELTLALRTTRIAKQSELKSGFGSSPIVIALELTPLPGQAFFLMGKEEVEKLSAFTLTESSPGKGFSSPQFQEGYFYFLIQKAIAAIGALDPFEDLSLKMAKLQNLPEEESLCIDVEIRHPKQTLWGRIVCPSGLHRAFKNHFAEKSPPSLTGPLAEKIALSLQMEVGQTTLTPAQLKKISPGDFLVLDRCSFDPQTHKGTLTACLHQKPLFRVRIKDNSLKIVDYAFYNEEENPMTPHSPEDEDAFGEEPLEGEELSLDDLTNESTEEESSSWTAMDSSTQEMISPLEVPITLSVEASRIQMNLSKLLELAPGNVLEFPVHPEQGVDLVVNGKKIGRGELVKLGDILGVKILQIGN